MPVRIGTRGSPLALWQAEHVRDRLAADRPDDTFELVRIVTTGDAVRDRALSQVGGKGLFTKEIEQALLDRRIDLAVHSGKDLPTELPEGLGIGAVLARENPQDVLVGATLDELDNGARVGTSSLRRTAQLLARRPDLRVEPVRGNVDTRLRKLAEGEYQALCMAAAGLVRLGRQGDICQWLSVETMVPAPAQGAIVVECRDDDVAIRERLARIECSTTRAVVDAERHTLARLAGGCQTPIGIHAWIRADRMFMLGNVLRPDGTGEIRASAQGCVAERLTVADQLVDLLCRAGAQRLLAEIRAGHS